jgi:histidyl-tRNA synthetase
MGEDNQIQLDLRDLKLKDKLSFIMNNQNTFLKENAHKTIVIGVKELQENFVTVKVDGGTENLTISMNELHKIFEL